MSDPQYASLNGVRITHAAVMIPMFGAWVADITIAEDKPIPNACTLQIGNLSLVGTVYRAAGFTGSKTARIVAGGGGWRNPIAAQAYSNPGGLALSTLAGDAARLAGETLIVKTDRIVGVAYAREYGPAIRSLRQLAGPTWWIDPAGVTRLETRKSDLITSPFTVVTWSGSQGRFEIATEDLASWMPARTFNAPTIGSVQTANMVSLNVDNEGKARLEILNATGGTS